jgi:CheY-like chemotaxis protein
MQARAAGQRVLIIDDEEAIRVALTRHLQTLGYQAEAAGGGAEGLSMVLASRPDAVILDLRMAGLDGHALLRRFGTAAPGLPVVVLSGSGTMDDVIAVLRAGAADFLRKPWTRVELEAALSRALGQGDKAPGASAPRRGRFEDLLGDFDPEALAADPSVTIGVWADFTIGYYNPAYLQFAADNGAPGIERKYGLGASLLDSMPGPLRGYYENHLRTALSSGVPWEHDYLCDSPTLERSYRLMAMPLRAAGLLLVHSLRSIGARGGETLPLLENVYQHPEGTLVQCSHCRRLRRVATPSQWDFVPAALAPEVQSSISHGLCHPCLSFYYSN